MKIVSIDGIVQVWNKNDTRYLALASHETIAPKRSKLFVKRDWRSVIDKLTALFSSALSASWSTLLSETTACDTS